MSLLERLGELGKALLTTDTELKHLRETIGEVRQEIRGLVGDMQDIRERLTRLETLRDADRAEMAAGLAMFKTEVERAEIRLTKLLPPPQEQPER